MDGSMDRSIDRSRSVLTLAYVRKLLLIFDGGGRLIRITCRVNAPGGGENKLGLGKCTHDGGGIYLPVFFFLPHARKEGRKEERRRD